MSQLVETQQLSFTNTSDSYATFGTDIQSTGSAVQKVILKTSADVYVSFDTPASQGQPFKILASNTAESYFDFKNGNVLTVHAKGVSGSGTLYIAGIRN